MGDVTPEVWFSVLADSPNVSVYLPLDICTNCRNTTGEEMLGEAIATAEEWSGVGMGLEVEAKDLRCVKRREYERKEFMDNIMRSTGLAVSKLNPATAALASVSQRLKAHSQQITNLERTLNKACGTNTQKRRRILMQKNQLLPSTLQAHPKLAENVRVTRPECDFSKCTMCGECVAMCPTFACDLKGAGRFTLESTYCVGCGLCAEVCPDHAITMVETDAAELIVPDPEEEKRAAEAEKARQEALKAKEEAKKKLSAALDKVEKLLRVAKELGVSLSVLALAWILRKPAVTSVITGASKASQLAGNLAASGFRIPQEALEEIEKILDYHPFVRRIG